jgi:hypothetical protein
MVVFSPDKGSQITKHIFYLAGVEPKGKLATTWGEIRTAE